MHPYKITLLMGGWISTGCHIDWTLFIKRLGIISAFGEQEKPIHMLHLGEGDWGRYWLCSCILPVTQFCGRLLRDLCWDYVQSSVEAYFLLWGQTLSCSTVIPSTASVPLCRGNNPILLTATDDECMPCACVGVRTASGEWREGAGE